jgi:hypothetical protein
MIKKESEAWEMIADTLEMAGMPFNNLHRKSHGLCEITYQAADDRVISWRCAIFMRERIFRHLSKNQQYLAKNYAVKPRILWARKFAEEARREGN